MEHDIVLFEGSLVSAASRSKDSLCDGVASAVKASPKDAKFRSRAHRGLLSDRCHGGL